MSTFQRRVAAPGATRHAHNERSVKRLTTLVVDYYYSGRKVVGQNNFKADDSFIDVEVVRQLGLCTIPLGGVVEATTTLDGRLLAKITSRTELNPLSYLFQVTIMKRSAC